MMLIFRLTLTALCLACWLAPASRAQAPGSLPRIAIISASDDKDTSSLADLLTAAMSQDAQGYELVERAELNRIAQEAEVQALNATERPRALARLAKADGLILLTAALSAAGQRSISVRLSSTGSGLIQKTFMLAADTPELPAAAKLTADALRFPARRLTKAGSAAPLTISLLGVRASVTHSPGVAIETTLNASIAHHLSNIAGLAVVERWKLDDVAFERSLSEKDMPALATATALVDGSLEIQDGAARVKVRIRTTQTNEGRTISVILPSGDVFAMAKHIADKVAAECGSHAIPKPWDAAAEAGAYARLGGWLLNHLMAHEAAQAYESAVALGDSSAETLFKRIYAYIVLSCPKDRSSRSNNGFEERWVFVQFGLSAETDPSAILAALRGIHRATAYAEDLLGKPWQPHPGFAWKNKTGYVANIATVACRTLVAAHRLKIHLAHPGEVAALRQRTEALVKLHQKEAGWHGDHLLDLYAGYWSATPEQAAEHWWDLLRPEPSLKPWQWSLRRSELANDFQVERFGLPGGLQTTEIRPQIPLFADWNTPDNSQGNAAWREFLAKLRASKSLLNQADAFALDIYTRPIHDEREKLLADYLDLLERNRELLMEPQGQAVFFAYEPRVRPTRYPPKFFERYASLLETVLAKSAKIDPEIFDPAFLMLRISLGQFRLFAPFVGQTDDGKHLLSKENAAKLLLAIEGCASRATGKSRAGTGTSVEDLARTIRLAYPEITARATHQPAPAAASPEAIPIRHVNLRTEEDPSGGRLSRLRGIIAACGDQIICRSVIHQQTGFAAIDRNFATTFIPSLPTSIYQTPYEGTFPSGFPPAPTENGFFMVSLHGMLLHYSYRDRKWTDESGLLPEHVRNAYQGRRTALGPGVNLQYLPPVIGFIQGSLYLGITDRGHTIGRILHGKYELIASSRRVPPEHPVDEVPPSSVTALFPGPDGRPHALLTLPDRTEVHDLELRRRVGTFMLGSRLHFDGQVAVIGNTHMVSIIEPDSGKPVNLIRVHSGNKWDAHLAQDISPKETVWDWPRKIPETSFSMGRVSVGNAVHGDCLFYLVCAHSEDTHARVALHRPTTSTLSLLCFQPGRREPLEIPLGFSADAKMDFQSPGAIPTPPPHPHAKYDVERLKANSAGIFFDCSTPVVPGGDSGSSPPSVLCVTWNDVNDWLTRHGHTPIGTRKTK